MTYDYYCINCEEFSVVRGYRCDKCKGVSKYTPGLDAVRYQREEQTHIHLCPDCSQMFVKWLKEK